MADNTALRKFLPNDFIQSATNSFPTAVGNQFANITRARAFVRHDGDDFFYIAKVAIDIGERFICDTKKPIDLSKGEEASEEEGEQEGKQKGDKASEEANEDAGEDRGEEADEDRGEKASEEASEKASKHAGEEASKDRGEEAGEEVSEKASEEAGEDAGKDGGETQSGFLPTMIQMAKHLFNFA
jgi:hypothetical protein